MSFSYQILYWRDIPAQIKVRSGRERISHSLSPRFQEAIDAAAMHGRTTSTEAYLDAWRASDWQTAEGDPEKFVASLAAQLEADYPDDRLETLKANQGYA